MRVAVGSVKGSPGVSTFCLALAARWPASVRRVVVECDPAGGDLAARYGLGLSPGLVSLAAEARTHTEADVLWRHTQVLPGGLPVVVAPPGAEQARAALTRLPPTTLTPSSIIAEHPEKDSTNVAADAAAREELVVLDCGRLDPDSPAIPLARNADLLLLLMRPRADEVAHLAHRVDDLRSWAPRLTLLLAGDGYSPAEVSRELGIPVLATVPDDRVAAAAMTGQQLVGVRWPRHRHLLSDAAARIAQQITGTPSRSENPQAFTGPAPDEPSPDAPAAWSSSADTPRPEPEPVARRREEVPAP